MMRLGFLAAALSTFTTIAAASADPLPRLKVSDNKRFLVTADGQPFFWLADTAWELLHRLNREEAERYLKNRAERRFNVIQAVVLAERNGLTEPNPYGDTPLRDNDPMQTNEEYFALVDWIVARANALGIYIGMLPTWGDKWNRSGRGGPEIFTPENAERFGEWLGRRYKDAGIVWILGGDRRIDTEQHKSIIRAMARGLRAGDGGAHLMTWHPRGGEGSAMYFHDDEWLDFNMRQNGHAVEFTGRYDQTRVDYDRLPIKPVLDGEPVYEDHPISFDAKKFGHSIASDVRRTLYWDVFTGAFGYTYGHHSVWQMWAPPHEPVNNPLMPWYEAIEQPGAAQMQHGRALMESRPFLTRVPDQSVLVTGTVPTSVPGAGSYQFVATRDANGSYAMVYAPIGRKFAVRMNVITGSRVKTWWFNPRNGRATAIGTFANTGERTFMPPDAGETLDWVLVLDDESKNFPPPGAKSTQAREERIAAGSASLYAREIGQGQPILMLHGGPDFDHSYLLPELDQLGDAFRVIYYDQRGRGKSAEGVQPQDVTLTSDVNDVDAVRKHFRLDAAVLLGHSWGAVLALEYALRHPTRVSHLILMNPAPASASDFALLRKVYAQKMGADLNRQKTILASAAYKAGDPEAVTARYRLHFKPALKRSEDYEKLMARMKAAFFSQGKEGIVKAQAVEDRLMRDTWEMEGYDLLAKLRALRIPTLVLYGDHDFIPAEISVHIARAIPRARLVTLRDCGHFAYLECAGDVRKALNEFFSASSPHVHP